ncbi:3-hydroxyisobutyrate dehydrogenase [Sphingomonas sp. BAUL-RG-20F-R05-02]|uniref:3-hydroxyisobutyrate dehydrogenase n=1 Tax=Sphingomonas sp. BAUL-RG-20F-R05-02 TaxID=2914830 RepID=UPI001F5AFF68|nr:3-hydroxyisobutyrate dehydrogenase [Sphingomonas sp. BAUL-RG-20F-R05-02]
MARIAFIGLGNMGGGMAANLARHGHDVHAFDVAPDALERAVASGCVAANNASAACEAAEVVLTMLPAGQHVEAVYSDSIFTAAPPQATLIDCSTIDVATAKRVAAAGAAAGFAMLDAPVSGGIAAAAAGTLTFMVGGTDAGFAVAQPYLSQMGKTVVHAGASGSGQAAKICNNMMLGAEMIATCEAFLLAAKLGLDPQKFFEIASVSSGQSWSLTTYAPWPGVGPETPADRGYQGGFATALMLKDLRLAAEAAASVGAATPMGARATQLYEAFAADGHGARDFSAILTMLQAQSDNER